MSGSATQHCPADDSNERTPLFVQNADISGVLSRETVKPKTAYVAVTDGSDIQDDDPDSTYELTKQPRKYKAVALLCTLCLAVGSHFAAHTLGAMKNIVKQEFGISNSQYGVLQSSVSIVNTVLPVAGGILLDAFGTSSGSLITTVLICVGNILVALSTHTTNLPTMIVGRILYGIGSGAVVIVQETILSQWFKGRSLAAVVALMLTVSRLASFLAQATVVSIAQWTGWYGYGFWFSALLCVFSLLINLIYLGLLRRLGTQKQQQTNNSNNPKRRFSWSKLLYLPHSYWLIAAQEFLLGGAWGCFLHINSEMVKMRFGYDNARAAATASVAQILPIFLMPGLGLCVDRYGKRSWMMVISGLTFLVSMGLLGYTAVVPIVGMLFFSVSLALGPIGLVSSVPIILPLSLVGTGMGLIKSSTNIGATLFDIASGLLQDMDPHQGYAGVITFFVVIGVLATVAALALCIIDRVLYHGLLQRPAASLVMVGDDDRKNESNIKLDVSRSRVGVANWIYGGTYGCLAILSWVLFFSS